MDTLEHKDDIVRSYVEEFGFVNHHLDSFNYFIEVGIKKIVEANSKVVSEASQTFYLKYLDIRVGKPNVEEGIGISETVYPQQCRLRDLTYAAPITVDIEFIKGQEKIIKKDVPIGRMPIMLRSHNCHLYGKSREEMIRMKECPLDPGGYFVVNGTEKVILMQEQLAKNRLIVEDDPKSGICCQVTSSTHDRKTRTNIVMKHGGFYLKHNSFTDDIPIGIVFKALGIESDKEIFQLVTGGENNYLDYFLKSVEDMITSKIRTQKQALAFMGQKLRPKSFNIGASNKKPVAEEVRDYFFGTFLAHIPVYEFNLFEKAVYLAMVIRRMIQAHLDKRFIDDRDYYGNKKLEVAGSLMSLLFEDVFKRLNMDLKTIADKLVSKVGTAPFDITKHIKQDTITTALNSAISTGKWKITRFRMSREGITQVLSRLSYISALGMMTRIQSQYAKMRKMAGPRSLHSSQWGIICPSDTPEGESCGLVKNLALLAHITVDEEEEKYISLAYDIGVWELGLLSPLDLWKHTLVFVNGQIIGITTDYQHLVNTFRYLRRKGRLSPFLSIYYNSVHHAVYLACDGGRLCRPLIIVKDGRPLLTQEHIQMIQRKFFSFTDLVKFGVIEYLDVNELNDCLVALEEKNLSSEHTHMEIEKFPLLGVCAGLIPYPHHNQSPRNTYQCAMGKQAMGTIGLNQQERIDTLRYNLVYPQKPLADTKTIKMCNFESLSAGINAIVAVMSYSGFDIEDAIVLNKSAVERGFARCMVYRSEKETINKYANNVMDEVKRPPDDGTRTFKKVYGHLDQSGIIAPGQKVCDKQIMINKYVPMESKVEGANAGQPGGIGLPTSQFTWEHRPLTYRLPDPSYIEKVMMSSHNGVHTIKISLRQTRDPEVGDKFSSRHGQKGVVGKIVPEQDLPFSTQGIRPDLIMNPHGFPSRMTVGKMIELLAGKAACFTGEVHDATAFAGCKVEDISEELVKAGYNYLGKDVFYHGQTGKIIPGYIYSGPVYYQKLKHMVKDKMHARARGPVNNLTRQPLEGRARDGGLRVGEMERDCMISHGGSMLLLERLMLSSDVYNINVCNACGLMGYEGWCQLCRSSANMASVQMPYATKLLLQELMAMGIAPKLELSSYFTDKIVG